MAAAEPGAPPPAAHPAPPRGPGTPLPPQLGLGGCGLALQGTPLPAAARIIPCAELPIRIVWGVGG